MRCRTAHSFLITARDGELGARRRHALDRHLSRCAACRTEQVAIEGVLAALDRLPDGTDVPARLEQNVMRRVRALADEPVGWRASLDPSRWRGTLAPALAAGAVAAITVVGLRSSPQRSTLEPLRTPTQVAVAPRVERAPVARRPKTRVPDEPPAELASRPELFVDLPVIRNLDKLQHFESIATMEDDATDAPPPSNG
jgi:anti-sigma factor RsiW